VLGATVAAQRGGPEVPQKAPRALREVPFALPSNSRQINFP
jgi:hypothetical protein